MNLKQMLEIIASNYEGWNGEDRFIGNRDEKGMRFIIPYALFTLCDKAFRGPEGRSVTGPERHLYHGLIVQPEEVSWDGTIQYSFDDFRRKRIEECEPGTRESFIYEMAKAPEIQRYILESSLRDGAHLNGLVLHGKNWGRKTMLCDKEISELRYAMRPNAPENLREITEEHRVLLHLLYLPTVSANISIGTKDCHFDYILTLPEAFSVIETERTGLASSKQRMVPTFHEL